MLALCSPMAIFNTLDSGYCYHIINSAALQRYYRRKYFGCMAGYILALNSFQKADARCKVHEHDALLLLPERRGGGHGPAIRIIDILSGIPKELS